jgi:hypothetical protein
MAVGFDGKFESINPDQSNSGERGFKYTDSDGDSLTVWRYEQGAFYVKARTSGDVGNGMATVRVPVDHVDKLIEELRDLKKARCEHCEGTGYRG